MTVFKPSLLVLCLLALSMAVIAQESSPGDILNCTDAGVLTPDGIKLKQPAQLLRSSRTRSGIVEAAFADASEKSLVFIFGGINEHTGQFKVIHQCRIVEGDIKEVRSEVLPKDSKEAKAITDFLTSWIVSNFSEEKRSAFQRMLSGRRYSSPEFDILTKAEQDAFWICEILQLLGRPVGAGAK